MNTNNQQGYIALISIMIIGAVLITLTISTSSNNALLQNNWMANVSKAQSKILAESCVDVALRRLTIDPEYSGNESIIINNADCYIQNVLHPDSVTTLIATQAEINHATTKLEANVNTTSLTIQSLKEILN